MAAQNQIIDDAESNEDSEMDVDEDMSGSSGDSDSEEQVNKAVDRSKKLTKQ